MAATLGIGTATLTLKWGQELDAVAARLAQKAGQSKAEYLRQLLLDAMEDAEDYLLAEEAMEEHRQSGGKTYTSEELKRELGLDD